MSSRRWPTSLNKSQRRKRTALSPFYFFQLPQPHLPLPFSKKLFSAVQPNSDVGNAIDLNTLQGSSSEVVTHSLSGTIYSDALITYWPVRTILMIENIPSDTARNLLSSSSYGKPPLIEDTTDSGISHAQQQQQHSCLFSSTFTPSTIGSTVSYSVTAIGKNSSQIYLHFSVRVDTDSFNYFAHFMVLHFTSNKQWIQLWDCLFTQQLKRSPLT